jgi:Na+/H+ antiporter NhaD/arsenite permease-like protein
MLMAEALLSNIGGMGTLIGDPPNILIGSAADFSFNDFLVHTLPPAILSWIVSLLVLRLIYRRELRKRSERLEVVINMKEDNALKDRKSLNKCLLSLGIILILFLLQEIFRLKVSFIALLGAVITFALVRPDPEKVFQNMEWSVLAFFISLFVVIGGLESAGVFSFIGKNIESYAKVNMFICTIFTFWFSAFLSSLVGAVPYVLALIPILKYISLQGINVDPLWWSLALGCGLGGNGTPIGTAANIITITISESTSHPITFKGWIKTGYFVMLVTCLITTIFLTLFYSLYTT